MPRYHFHMQTDARFSDDEVVELAGPIGARRQATLTCGEMLRDAPEGFWGSRPWNITVTDAQGLVLWEIMIDGTASPAAP